MATPDWRKVNLLDLKLVDNGSKIGDALKDGQYTSSTSGRGQNIICDSFGKIHIFDRNWDCITFQGHDTAINLCSLSIKNNLLVTISGEEVNEVLKVWNLSKITKDYGALCLRKVTTELLQKPTALALTDDGQLMAIGYDQGYINLYRGDIGRDNTKMLKKIFVSKSSIVGIAFKVQEKNVNMFVCSNSCIAVYNIKGKDKEIVTILDDKYSPTRCCALQSNQDSEDELGFIVGKDDAIYCFTADGRGPCYVVEGQKTIVDWFRTSLIIISKLPKTTTKQSLSVIDIQNNIIIFSCNIDEVVAIFKEFGYCNILTKNNELFILSEKDLESKLNILFKKSQYEVAVKIASRQQYNAEGIAGIYKQYADHLYSKRDYKGAVENYKKTIGYLEPSYVTRKFLDSKHTKYITSYLLALHQSGQATSNHQTTLLLNCLARLELKEELTDLLSKEKFPDIKFDWDMAINICRKASVELSLELSKRNQKHDYYVNILIEDLSAYEDALNYILKLSENDAEKLLEKYGITLMNNSPDKTTDVLIKFCTEKNDNPDNKKSSKSLNPEKFLQAFFKNSDKLIEFLEKIIENRKQLSFEVLNTLIELYLRKWNGDVQMKDRLLNILKVHEGVYDIDHVLILCRLYDFVPGIVWIYEQNKLYHLALRYHLENRNYEELLKFCERNGSSEPSIWLQVLCGLKIDNQAPPQLLVNVLSYIHANTGKEQPPLQILNHLVAKDKNIKLSNVRDYFLHVLQRESQMTNEEEVKVNELCKDINLIKNKIENIRLKPVEFRNTTCDACQQRLAMPVIYFLCKHAFHQECLGVYSDSDKDCNICHDRYAQLNNALKAQSESRNMHQEFHIVLKNSQDPFSEVSKYFGFDLFNNIKLLLKKDDEQPEYNFKNTQQITNPITEAKLRLTEGNIKQIPSEVLVLKAEGRIRTEESSKYESLQLDKKNFRPLPRKVVKHSDKISKNLSKSTNPFEDEQDVSDVRQNVYDVRQKNSKSQSTNPFEIDEKNEEVSRPGRNIRSIEAYNNNLDPFA